MKVDLLVKGVPKLFSLVFRDPGVVHYPGMASSLGLAIG